MIFFDIDETLFDNGGAQQTASRKLYRDHEVLHELYPERAFPGIWDRVTEKYVRHYLSKQISFQEQRRRRLREIFQNDLMENEADGIFSTYLKYYEESWRLFDDVLSCLDELKEYDLGIISNGDSAQQRLKLSKLNILDRFAVIVISDDVGISKPNAEIFKYACNTTGVKPESCFHVGDSLALDARAACEAGLKGIWLNRKTEKKIDPGMMEIRHLGRLAEIVTRGD